MFLVDDLLLGPGKGAMLVFKELARKAQEDWLDDDAIKQELQEIYALVEAGKMSSQEFEARECNLLERLEQIARARFAEKWGGNEPPAIEAEIVAQPLLTSGGAPLVIETAPVIESVPMIEAPPVMRTQPEVATPIAIAAPIVEPPPLPEPPSAPATHITSTFQPPEAAQAPLAPQPPLAPSAPSAQSAPSRALTIGQVVESASRALSLLNLKVSVISSVSPEDDGWHVTAELVERRGVPDTNDQIGVYELRLDAAGTVTRYERTRLRRRGDLGR